MSLFCNLDLMTRDSLSQLFGINNPREKSHSPQETEVFNSPKSENLLKSNKFIKSTKYGGIRR